MHWTPQMGFTMSIWKAFLVPSYWWNTILKFIYLFTYLFHELAWIFFAVSLYTTIVIPEIIPSEITQSIIKVIGISELTTITQILCFAVFFVINCAITFFHIAIIYAVLYESLYIDKPECVLIPGTKEYAERSESPWPDHARLESKLPFDDYRVTKKTYPFYRHISTPESMYETIPDGIHISKYPCFEISYD